MIKFLKRRLRFLIKKYNFQKINTQLYSSQINKDLICGEGCIIGEHSFIGENVEIGRFTYLNSGNSHIHIDSNVKIGSFCSIAPGVSIGMGSHYTSYLTTHPLIYDTYYKKCFKLGDKQLLSGLEDLHCQTIIGNDVWIGANAWIKRGVKIGDGAVIAAGSIVTKNVSNYCIYGGVPAKKIGSRFLESQIEELNLIKSKWWTWPKDTISNNFELFYDVNKYIEKNRDSI